MHLQEIDRLEVMVLMDNLSDPFTQSHQGMRWNEFQYRFQINEHKHYSGKSYCRACNGLSFLIHVYKGNKKHTLLFDTGPDDGLVIQNAGILEVDLKQVEAIVISHGHNDHYGGLLSVLDEIGKADLPVYVHPELYTPRAAGLPNGERIENTQQITPELIRKHKGKVMEFDQPISILDDTVLISGEVPRRTPYEQGVPGALRKYKGQWESEPQVIDERILVFNLKGKGLCVLTGCGHTGVINALNHAKELVPGHIHLVMGGFHLAGSPYEERIKETMEDFQKINPDFLVTGHCTGRNAQYALAELYGDRHIPYGVGTYFSF